MKRYAVIINYTMSVDAVSDEQAIQKVLEVMPKKLIRGVSLDVIDIDPEFEKSIGQAKKKRAK